MMPAAFTHTEGGWKYWVCERRTLTGRREQKKVGEHHHLQRYFNALTLPSHLDACDQLRHALFRRHVHRGRHVTLPPEVTPQAADGVVGRLFADVGDHH